MSETKFPTETIELPSKGLLYPKDSPLHSGTVELKYMTARSEDILTNQNYIEKGTVVDKLLQDLIVDTTIDYSQLLSGDKNALLIAARILGYGKMYEFDYEGEKVSIDLSQLPDKPLDPIVANATENKFTFECPVRKNVLTFKLLTHGDEQEIDQEIRGLSKLNKDFVPELSVRVKHMILAVDGNEDRKAVRDFVDNEFLAADSRAFRKYVNKIQPDVNLKFYPEDSTDSVNIPIGISFLWPDVSN